MHAQRKQPTIAENITEPTGRYQANAQGEPHNNSLTRHRNGQGSANRCKSKHTTNPQNNRQGNILSEKKGLRKRMNIKIGTINVNGLHTSAENRSSFEKWAEINDTMKKEKIAVLAVQETHLDNASTEAIHKSWGKRLVVINSQLDTNLEASAGVAFVLNKELIDTKTVEKYELIKGRALATQMEKRRGNSPHKCICTKQEKQTPRFLGKNRQ